MTNKEGNGYIFNKRTVSLIFLISILLVTALGSASQHYKQVEALENRIVQLQDEKEKEIKKSAELMEEIEQEKGNTLDKEKELSETKGSLKKIESRNTELEKEINDISKKAEIKRVALEKEKKAAVKSEPKAGQGNTEVASVVEEKKETPNGDWKEMSVEATAYTMVANGDKMGGTGLTSTGKVPTAFRTVAVDPSVIPYGSLVQYNGTTYVAEDTGGVINGNKIDFYKDTLAECEAFGRQHIKVLVKTS